MIKREIKGNFYKGAEYFSSAAEYGLPGQVRQKVVSNEEAHEDPVVNSPLEVVGEGQVRHLQVSPVTILI